MFVGRGVVAMAVSHPSRNALECLPFSPNLQYGGPQRAQLHVCTGCIWPPQSANRPVQPDAGSTRPRAYQHARAERASHLKSDDGALWWSPIAGVALDVI